MKRLGTFLFVALALFLAVGAAAGAQPQIPPAPTASFYVQDYAKVLTAETKDRINSLGAQLASRTKAQIVVVTVDSLHGAAPEDYGLAILRGWGVGDRKLNNGVVILVAVGDRQSRIEVGYGLEGALPDAKTGSIQDEYMIPYFQQGDYDKGIWNGYLAVAREVAKEYNLELKAEPRAGSKVRHAPPASRGDWWDVLPWWVKLGIAAGLAGLFIIDWVFFGGAFTFLLLSLLRRGGGGGGGWGGGGGYGGGSGGGGGSSRRW